MILVHFLSGPWSAKFSVRTIRWRNQELLCFWSTCKRQRLQIYEDMFVWQVSHVQKKLVTQVLHAPLQKIETIDYVTHTSSCSNCSTSCSKSIVDVNMSQNWRANMIRCALVGLSVSWGVNPQLQGRWMSFLPIFLALMVPLPNMNRIVFTIPYFWKFTMFRFTAIPGISLNPPAYSHHIFPSIACYPPLNPLSHYDLP